MVYFEKPMERLGSGELKIIFKIFSCIVIIGLMKNGEARVGGNKKRFQYCTDSSGSILYFRTLQDHSGHNLVDFLLQDNVEILDGFFKSYIMSDVQSIYIPSSIRD